MKPIILNGEYGEAHIYAKTVEDGLIEQCLSVLNNELSTGSKIRIMPDTHVGKGCMIGTTMTISDRVCPNLVGVDIGCGMLTIELGTDEIDLGRFDEVVSNHVPMGFSVHEDGNPKRIGLEPLMDRLRAEGIDKVRAAASIGTLGGGNHFIEIDKDEETGKQYLVIHTGSRYLGKQVAEFWQGAAEKKMLEDDLIDIQSLVNAYKALGWHTKISSVISDAKKANADLVSKKGDRELATLKGRDMINYINDMEVAMKYARLNRLAIADAIVGNYYGSSVSNFDSFDTMHNYIDVGAMVLRKGAISAENGERALIPLNMRDGSLIVVGKGNEDWNRSAPHGAGRIMSRSQARASVNINDFEESMRGVYSSSVCEGTIDESPFVYKSHAEIVDAVRDTVDIVKHIKPIYNRKA